MRIKKVSQTAGLVGSVVNSQSESNKDTYSCDYINGINTYSTDEVNTGMTWIDGKTIYRKIVDAGSSSGSGFSTVAHNIANIDTLCEYDAYMYDSSSIYKLPWWNSFSEGNFYKVYVDKTNIQKHCNNNWGFSSRVIIYYTKTTD